MARGAPAAGTGCSGSSQVFDGMDVVDTIAGVSVNKNPDKPLSDVEINSMEVTTYKG